jgi:hypothetical protein
MSTGEADSSAAQPQGLFSRSSVFLSEVLDSLSILLFSLSLSSLAHLIGSLWFRFLAEE